MKAHRRQELKTNELAQTLADVKEFLEKYGTYVGGGAVIVVGVLVASLWWRNSLQSKQRGQWEDLYALQEASVKLLWGQPENAATGDTAGPDFATLAARHRRLISSTTDPQIKLRALSALGDLSWRYARLGPDAGPGTEVYTQALDESESAYRQLAGDYADDHWIRGSALISLAVIAEERGDFDQAEELYNELVSDSAFADTILATSAAEALDSLDDLREEIVFAPAPPPPLEPAAIPAAGTAELAAESPGEVTAPVSAADEAAESADPEPTDPPDQAVAEPQASVGGEQQPGEAAPPTEPSGTPAESSEGEEPAEATTAQGQDSTAG